MPGTRHDRSRPVVVCGAGAAGIAAALSAARSGAGVCLVEIAAAPGGTVAHALIHTLGGLYDANGELVNQGLPRELTERLFRADFRTSRHRMGRLWVLRACPTVYQTAVQRWLAAEPRITLLTGARVVKLARTADEIGAVEIATPAGIISLRPQAIIDATGTGDAVRMIDPQLMQCEMGRAAGGLIFRMRGTDPKAFDISGRARLLLSLRSAATEGRLPAACDKAWVDRGLTDDEMFVKLFVPLPDDWQQREDRGEITHEAHRQQSEVVAFLKELPGFAHASVVQTGTLGVRDGGRVRGEYRLTAADVRQARKFDDAACRACWPIEYWDPTDGVSLEYLPDGACYDIPMRSLKVAGLTDLWVAGKCLSADAYAQASARVAGTCWAMGEAAGRAAALSSTSGCSPRVVDRQPMRGSLQ